MPRPGELFSIEFLTYDPNSERFVLFYKPSLERLGITVSVRNVDETQYVNRERNWDYDSTTEVWGQSLRPAMSSATTGARPPPIASARATTPASRTRRSMR
jgi:ABC-type oligopeptide transport system substrate-binding subunit